MRLKTILNARRLIIVSYETGNAFHNQGANTAKQKVFSQTIKKKIMNIIIFLIIFLTVL